MDIPNTKDSQETAKKNLNYKSPSGKIFTPKYAIVATEEARKYKSFSFVEKDGTYVQDLGMTSPKLKLKLWFIGPHHDNEAEQFREAISERGVSGLYLPLDRVSRAVVPVKFKQSVDFVQAVNRTVFVVDFQQTTEAFADVGYETVSADIARLSEEVSGEAISGFGGQLKGLGSISTALKSAQDKVALVKSKLNFSAFSLGGFGPATLIEWRSTLISLDRSVADLYSQPFIFASQMHAVITSPVFPTLTSTFSAYGGFLDSILNPPEAIPANLLRDELALQELSGAVAISALATKIAQADFRSREEALDAFAQVGAAYEGYAERLSSEAARTEDLSLAQRFAPNSALSDSLYQLIARMTGSLDRLIIGLRQEVIIFEAQDTTPLNLAAKYYPEIFSTDPNAALATIEQSNELDPDQRFLIEGGTPIKVYI